MKSSRKSRKAPSPARDSLSSSLLSRVRPSPVRPSGLSAEQKVRRLEALFAEVMTVLDLDLENESLKETPLRLAKMYVHELFSGLQPEAFPKLTRMPNEMGYDQMIIVRKVKVMSVCEHHFATIDGEATVAYIPKDWVIGLSKINRVVDYFSRRPQVQERLTKQIADCLESALETQHVAVHIRAKHHCVASRGVQDVNSVTSTCDLRGDFRIRAETRAEFLGACVTEGR